MLGFQGAIYFLDHTKGRVESNFQLSMGLWLVKKTQAILSTNQIQN